MTTTPPFIRSLVDPLFSSPSPTPQVDNGRKQPQRVTGIPFYSTPRKEFEVIDMAEEGTVRGCRVCDAPIVTSSFKCPECGARQSKRKGNSRSTNPKNKALKPEKKCYGKQGNFKTVSQAKAEQKRVYQNRGTMQRYYYCTSCKSYHLTKSKT